MTQDTLANLLSENRLSDISLEFLESIKFKPYHLETSERFEIISYVNNSPSIVKKISNSQYQVGFCKKIDLKPSKLEEDVNTLSLNNININRKSTRKYSSEPISFQEFSDFLRLFYCITGEEVLKPQGEEIVRKRRNIASGGSMYPAEIFFVNNRITDIEKGVYRYNIYTSQIEQLKVFNNEEDMQFFLKLLMYQGGASTFDYENASVYLLLTTIINKHSFKYQDFGMFLSFVDVGQLVHSAYLSSSALNLACCASGGILNDELNSYLDLRNPLHHPALCLILGKPKNS